ncbi:MAG: Ig-like domain-containing protein, partial [Jatrophihabitantaceae bacterium]
MMRTARRRFSVVLIAALATGGALLGAAPAASAATIISVGSNFPTNVTVGQTNVAASLTIINSSTPPDAASNVTVTAITLVPSCGTQVIGADCPAASTDPGVFQLSPTAVGEAGTACAGITFAITLIDPVQGRYSFIPSSPVILGPTGTSTSVCIIDFLVNVLRAPTKDASPAAPGLQTSQLAFAASGNISSGSAASLVTVNPAATSLTTQVAPAAITVGAFFNDTATLTRPAGGPVPTGTVTFAVFGPGNPTCTGVPVFTSTNPLNAAGTTAVSTNFTPTLAGTYRVVATYSGDANYLSSASACGD